MHLWESEHPYTCGPDDHYAYARDAAYLWPNWSTFFAKFEDADFNVNLPLLYRWDWQRPDPEDPSGTKDALYLFFDYFSAKITVTAEDEPAIRAWLAPRYAHMLKLWSPLGEDARERSNVMQIVVLSGMGTWAVSYLVPESFLGIAGLRIRGRSIFPPHDMNICALAQHGPTSDVFLTPEVSLWIPLRSDDCSVAAICQCSAAAEAAFACWSR